MPRNIKAGNFLLPANQHLRLRLRYIRQLDFSHLPDLLRIKEPHLAICPVPLYHCSRLGHTRKYRQQLGALRTQGIKAAAADKVLH